MAENTEGVASTYEVELLFEEAPTLSKAEFLAAIRAYCPGAEALDPTGDALSLGFIHTDHPVVHEGRTLPAQTLVMAAKEPREISKGLAEAIDQSWTFEGVREVVARCRYSVLVTDLMSAGLPYRERLALFQRVLAGILDVVSPQALHWVSSRQIIAPSRFREAYKDGGSSLLFAGAINVRFFNVSESQGDMIMDTLGLTALGLPDLQCHFRDLNPNEVAAVLYNTSNYLFGYGDVIADGHTLAGIEDESHWRCQRGDSLASPARLVIDLDPGPPYAVGDRSSPLNII